MKQSLVACCIAMLFFSSAACHRLLSFDGGEPVTGLEGQALRGPICPVEHVDQPCPDQPFSALFEVFDRRDRQVARFQSDENGYFQVGLDPGTYTIVPDASAPIMDPQSQRRAVTVLAGEMTQTTLVFDTGIR